MEELLKNDYVYFQRHGHVAISNLLLDVQDELDISDTEMLFIIKACKINRKIINDSDFGKHVSTKTLQRKRASLKAKGLLDYSIVKGKGSDGRYKTIGIAYDLKPLEDRLQAISDNIYKAEEEKAAKIIEEKKILIEKNEEETTSTGIEKYKEQYNIVYGHEPVISCEDYNFYNKLKSEEQDSFGYVFSWLFYNHLEGRIIPNVVLFRKTPYRFNSLVKYCKDWNLVKTAEEEAHEEAENIFNTTKKREKFSTIVLNKFFKDYADKYPLLKIPFEDTIFDFLLNFSVPNVEEEVFDKVSKNMNFFREKFNDTIRKLNDKRKEVLLSNNNDLQNILEVM